MIANAGIERYSSLLNMQVEQWDLVMKVNARGPMLQYKYAAEQMVKQGRGGRIIGRSAKEDATLEAQGLRPHRSFFNSWEKRFVQNLNLAR